MIPWVLLVVAGLLEVVWAYWLKQTNGFTRLWPSVITIGAMLASFVLLARAMQTLPLGVSYTVWVGIGAVGAVIVGVALLGERLSPVQVISVVLVVVGIVGLKVSTITKPTPASPPGVAPLSTAPERGA